MYFMYWYTWRFPFWRKQDKTKARDTTALATALAHFALIAEQRKGDLHKLEISFRT